MNHLKQWMSAATQQQKIALADLAGTTVPMLNQIAGGYKRADKSAVVRSGLAIRLEHAAKALSNLDPKLPELLRTDLSPECRGCDFARACLGDKMDKSGFNVVTES